jgi:hypothetical protein
VAKVGATPRAISRPPDERGSSDERRSLAIASANEMALWAFRELSGEVWVRVRHLGFELVV